MENSKIILIKTHIKDLEFSEIDFDLGAEFGIGPDSESDQIETSKGGVDTFPIAIDRLIEALEGLKVEGSTHISLDYHSNHIGYEISGWKIRIATPEEMRLKEERLKEERDKIKAKDIAWLEVKLNSLDPESRAMLVATLKEMNNFYNL